MSIDFETLAHRSARLDLEGIDFTAFADAPLDDETLRCLRYMHDVEYHTVCYLRDLLVTRAHRDPEITGFLSLWVYEELWHGDAIARVLRAHGEAAGPPRVAAGRRGAGLAPVVHAGMSAVLGDALTAVQVTWGAINEWTTQAGYGRLIDRAQHPVLTELLRRIMRQEGRHIDFYVAQATDRLRASRSAQRLTRLALERKWRPVGSGLMPDAEVHFLVSHLFDGPDGRAVAERIDRRVDRLPGLAGLSLASGAVERLAA